MASVSKYFTDRIVEYPGRINLIDVDYGTLSLVDVERAEGRITDPGTPFEADTFNRIADEMLDVGQFNADLIAAELTKTLSVNTTYWNGTIKYDKIGSLVIVYVSGTTSSPIGPGTVRTLSSSSIETAYRPSATISEIARDIPTGLLQVSTSGSVGFVTYEEAIDSGEPIKGEVAYFV